MHRIVVRLPENRDYCGELRLQIGPRLSLGPWPVAGRSSDELALRHGNPQRLRTLRYGDTPLGLYRLRRVLPTGAGTPYPKAQHGACGVLVFESRSGEGALAEANGRFYLGLIGGRSARNGRLRSTAGALRLANAHLRQLIGALTDPDRAELEILSTARLGAEVAVDAACECADPIERIVESLQRLDRPRTTRRRSALASTAPVAGAAFLGLSVSFFSIPAALLFAPTAAIAQGSADGTPAGASDTAARTGNPLGAGNLSNDPKLLRDRYIELKSGEAAASKLTTGDTKALEVRASRYKSALDDMASGLSMMQSAKDDGQRNAGYAQAVASIQVIKGLGDLGANVAKLYPASKPLGQAWDMGTGTGEAINKVLEGDYWGAFLKASKELAPTLVPDKAEALVDAGTSGAASGHDLAKADDRNKKVDALLDAIGSLAKAAGSETGEGVTKAVQAGKTTAEGINRFQEAGEEKEQLATSADAMIANAGKQIAHLQSRLDSVQSALDAPKSSNNDIDAELRTIQDKVPGIDSDPQVAAEVDDRAASIYQSLKSEVSRAPAPPAPEPTDSHPTPGNHPEDGHPYGDAPTLN